MYVFICLISGVEIELCITYEAGCVSRFSIEGKGVNSYINCFFK